MTRNRYQRIKRLLLEARNLEPQARRAFIEESCGDDSQLLIEVGSMLSLGERVESSFEEAAQGLAAGQFRDLISEEGDSSTDSSVRQPGMLLPERIGDFKIIRRIGIGGMGTVYEALQENPLRRVALKTLRSELLRPEFLQRFKREAEILGHLTHPGIAHIHHAGTFKYNGVDLPYIAMEYAPGHSLTRFAADAELDAEGRLELMALICDAAHYAHGKGVVHRDLKPDNILVTTDGQPKILDFGVARATRTDLQEITPVTQMGQIMGTLPYMSPEQMVGDPELVDARSDVYSLGVLLFELLCGRRPHDLSQRLLPDAARVIQEDDPDLLGSVDSRFRGDIETIVAKALEKDLRRRYPSAEAMANDIRRHLSHRPIEAHPPTGFYLLSKFVRRHRGLVAGVSVAFLALLSAALISARFGFNESRQREVAERSAYRATLAAASSELDNGTSNDMTRLLAEVPKSLRGWEWRYLQARTTLHIWEAEVYAFSPSGKGPRYVGAPVAFSQDGERLIAPLDEHRLAAFDVETGELAQLLELKSPWRAECLIAVGQGFLVATEDERLMVWNDQGGSVLHEQNIPGHPVAAAWDPIHGRLAVCILNPGAGGEHLWTLWTGKPGGLAPVWTSRSQVHGLGWAQAGEQLIVVRKPHGTLLDGQTWEQLGSFAIRANVSFAVSSDYFIAASGPRDVAVFETSQLGQDPARTFRGHSVDSVRTISTSLDGRTVASATRDSHLIVWDGKSGERLGIYELDGLPRVAVSPSGNRVALNSKGRLRVWSPRDEAVAVLPGPGGFVYNVAWTPDGRTLVARSLEQNYRFYDSVDGRTLMTLSNAPVHSPWAHFRNPWAISTDGQRLVSMTSGPGASPSARLLWSFDMASSHAFMRLPGALKDSLDAGQLRRDFLAASGARTTDSTHGIDSRSIAFSRGSVSLAHFETDPAGVSSVNARISALERVDADGASIVLHLPTLQQKNNALSDASFSPDGQSIVVAHEERDTLIYAVQSGKVLGELLGHTGPVYGVDYHPNGDRIATAGSDRTVRIWDALSFEQLVVLRGHSNYVKDVAWSPDGESLASASGDGTVRIWSTVSIAGRHAAAVVHHQLQAQQRPWVQSLFDELDEPKAVAASVRAMTQISAREKHAALRVVRELSNAWWDQHAAPVEPAGE